MKLRYEVPQVGDLKGSFLAMTYEIVIRNCLRN